MVHVIRPETRINWPRVAHTSYCTLLTSTFTHDGSTTMHLAPSKSRDWEKGRHLRRRGMHVGGFALFTAVLTMDKGYVPVRRRAGRCGHGGQCKSRSVEGCWDVVGGGGRRLSVSPLPCWQFTERRTSLFPGTPPTAPHALGASRALHTRRWGRHPPLCHSRRLPQVHAQGAQCPHHGFLHAIARQGSAAAHCMPADGNVARCCTSAIDSCTCSGMAWLRRGCSTASLHPAGCFGTLAATAPQSPTSTGACAGHTVFKPYHSSPRCPVCRCGALSAVVPHPCILQGKAHARRWTHRPPLLRSHRLLQVHVQGAQCSHRTMAPSPLPRPLHATAAHITS